VRLALVFGVALVLAAGAAGSWAFGRSGSGATSAKTIGAAVGAPTAGVSGHAVTLTWTTGHFGDGSNVPSYIVKRYDSVTNAPQTVLSACSGLVGALTCTESSVPTGTWKYTITPAAGSNWRGAESALSAVVVVLL
jgi:hypothetical protein